MNYESLKDEYAELWAKMDLRPGKHDRVGIVAHKILGGKAAYLKVEGATGVPWYFVGLLHAMESSCNFATHLHNGDSLKRRTYNVPAGRPKAGSPPFSWHVSAIDALSIKGLQKITDWCIPRMCYEAERFNGWGYRRHHPSVLSPYLWSYSFHYHRGKYISDGKWSSAAVSGQPGAMPILKVLMELDPEIKPVLTAKPQVAEAPEPEADPADEFRKAEPVPTKDLAKKSRKVGLLQRIRDWLAGLGISTAGISLADVTGTGGSNVKLALEFIRSHAVLGVVLGCLAGAALAALVLRYTREDYESGRYIPSGDHAEGE